MPTEHSPWGATRVACLCPFGHMHRAMQEAPRGAQAIFDLRSPLSVVCLKAGEHEF
jgi:hypothetical protein